MNSNSLIFPGVRLASSVARDGWSDRAVFAGSRPSRDSAW